MKAIVQDTYGSADTLIFADVERPEVGERDVLVRIHAAGTHVGDWHLMTGLPLVVRLGFGLRAPKARVRGTDFAGRVEQVGAAVTKLRPGDEVFGTCDGAFAEYALAREETLARRPAALSPALAAALPTSACTALAAVRGAEIGAGQRVLVIGATGGVGAFAVQLAKARGAEVTGVCSTPKLDLARALGCDHVIDYTREECVDGAQIYDVILDAAGNRPLAQLRRALAPEGRLIIVGGEGGGRWFGGVGRQLWALALSPFVGQTLRPILSLAKADDLEHLAGLFEAGELRPVVDRTYPLAAGADAIRHMEGGSRGKIIIDVGGGEARAQA